jgi:hypothetical protein
MHPYGKRSYLPNQFIVDLNTFIWTNPNNILGIFSHTMLFDAYTNTLFNSIGKADYDYGSLMEWVDKELGVDGNPDCVVTPLVNDPNFIQYMQSSVVAGFCDFITNNRVYVARTLIPVLQQVGDIVMVTQDDASHTVRLEYV